MTHGLNLTLPIKQDAETLKKLQDLKSTFAADIQEKIEKALKASKIVHFARVLVIDDKYIQVITAYEGPHREYTEFFRRELTPIFAAILSLADGIPDVRNPDAFFEYAMKSNIRSLGMTTSGSTGIDGEPAGWLFSAYDHMDVKDIQDKIQGV